MLYGKSFTRNLTIDDDRFYPLSKGSEIEATNDTYYEGFFQSVSYFRDCEEIVREEFRIKSRYVREFERKYRSFYRDNKIIAVHVRRTDYLIYGSNFLGGPNMTLPLLYYEKVFRLIENIGEYKIIFVGDDLSEVKSHFAGMKNALFETNGEIVDFQILQNADILVISNSTFSWWAAYLNPKKDKKVYAPVYWLGYKVKKDYPGAIYDKVSWNIVDFVGPDK